VRHQFNLVAFFLDAPIGGRSRESISIGQATCHGPVESPIAATNDQHSLKLTRYRGPLTSLIGTQPSELRGIEFVIARRRAVLHRSGEMLPR